MHAREITVAQAGETARRAALQLSKPLRNLSWLVPLLLAAAGCSTAMPSPAPASGSACDDEIHQQFDFWVGNWRVYDAATSRVVAYDRVRRALNGCVLEEHVTFLTDQYGAPAAGQHLEGSSLSVVQGGHWVMVYADNRGQSLVAVGQSAAAGTMTLTTADASRGNRRVRGMWRAMPDGTVRANVYTAPVGDEHWQMVTDLIFRPEPGGALPHGRRDPE